MEVPELGDALGGAMEFPEQLQQLLRGRDCVPETGEQQGKIQGAGELQPKRGDGLVTEIERQPGEEHGEVQQQQQQETREVHGGYNQQQWNTHWPMTEKGHGVEEVHGAEGQQPNREEVQAPDGQWQRQTEVLGTEKQQGLVLELERGDIARQQRKGKVPVSEKQQSEMHGPADEQCERMGAVYKAGEQQPRQEELRGTELHRWREALALAPRADPDCQGQQEREAHPHLMMKGPVPQDTVVCGHGLQSLFLENGQSWMKEGEQSTIHALISETGVEKQGHPYMKGDGFQGTWIEETTVGPRTEVEQEGKSWNKDQEKEHKMSTGMQCAYLLTSDNISEVKQLEETIEDMLMRLDEFCGMTDMIRNETTQLLDEDIHAIKAKMEDLNKMYTKVDKLEAFVKMVGRHVTFLEEQVVQAERDHQPLTHVVHKLLQAASIPSFIYKHSAKQQPYELPELFRTEDYIPLGYVAKQYRKT